MRSFNSVRNAVISIFYELMLVGFGLVIPRLIVDTYGSEVNGLASSVNNVLQILTLLQAGAAGASIFQMFKPVADKDYDKISIIMDSTRKFFCIIGTVFIILVIVISPVFGFLVEAENVTVMQKIIAFAILGLNGSFYMFFTSYFDVLFSSHQKRFILSVAAIIDKLVYYGLIILIITLKLDFMFMYLATLVGTVIRIAVLYAVYAKTYKPLIKKVNKPNNFKIPNRGYLLINQIAIQLITSVPTIAISFLSGGLKIASVFAYYYLVLTMIKMIFNTMQLSVCEVFGNLVVTKSQEEVEKVFSFLDYLFTTLGMIMCTVAAFSYMPFIYVYTSGNRLDENYMYPALAILNIITVALFCATQPYYTLTNVHGYYKETYMEAAVCAAIGSLLSIGLSFVSFELVMVGPIFFYVSSYVFRMYIAKKKLPYINIKNSLRRLCFLSISVAGAFLISFFVVYKGTYINSWLVWLLHTVICGVAAVILAAVYTALFERAEFKRFAGYVKAMLKKIFKKKEIAK